MQLPLWYSSKFMSVFPCLEKRVHEAEKSIHPSSFNSCLFLNSIHSSSCNSCLLLNSGSRSSAGAISSFQRMKTGVRSTSLQVEKYQMQIKQRMQHRESQDIVKNELVSVQLHHLTRGACVFCSCCWGQMKFRIFLAACRHSKRRLKRPHSFASIIRRTHKRRCS